MRRASLLLFALVGAARASAPPIENRPGDDTKVVISSELDEGLDKLPTRPKVKECCGYPVALPDQYRLSYYWLAYESEYANERYDVDIYDRYGFWIGRYPSAFVYELKLEGTGFLRDGRLLNYQGPCGYGMGTCFDVLSPEKHPMGRGVQNRALVPFRSVAVDPHRIPIGSPIFVPELVGVNLPDGSMHDGCLRADDMGGAIQGGKLDFFVESYFNFKYLADQLWWHMKATPHLDEPRCEYLRLGTPEERKNEHTDWAFLHSKGFQARQAMVARNAKARQRDRARGHAFAARHAAAATTLASSAATGKRRKAR